MDTSINLIKFDSDGYCNFCSDFLKKLEKLSFLDKELINKKKINFINKVKKSGINKRYDCIVGLSGGIDSSYTLAKAVESGLRPLAVHMDNGWNSELAQHNIENLVNKLEVDLFTYVIDWQEYKKLMQAFFEADVIDIELLYDNAMLAVNYQQASKYKIKYILSGSNLSTEGMSMPEGMNWFKYDKRNIKNIAKKFGNIKLKTFPSISTINYLWFEFIKKIHWISFLNYFDYKKDQATNYLKLKYDYKEYPYKHYESVFTRFYQGYILPKKFNVDKRILHLSNLVITKQMKRSDALEKIKKEPYDAEAKLNQDINFFLKKMDWDKVKLLNYLKREEKKHYIYKSEKYFFYFLVKIYEKIFGKGKRRNII